MDRHTEQAQVIDLSSDEEDCCGDPAVPASCKDSRSSRQNFHVDRSRSRKEGLTEQYNLVPSGIDDVTSGNKGVFGSLHAGSMPQGGSNTCNGFEGNKGQRQGVAKREAARRTVVHPPQTVRSCFLGPDSVSNIPSVCQEQISRRFWKAGDYEAQASAKLTTHGGMDHVRVHPKFLHSNATSHKWALGAIAELLDNAIDEVENGASFVSVDVVENQRDNSPALVIQDDGGGMDPDCMRQCMSLGYSRKTSNSTIGQYGNGFKTSTMRLGADVIVFSRCSQNSYVTQSVGLLSYTFLRSTGHEDIVVPMVDFEVPIIDGQPEMLLRTTREDWLNTFGIVLQWSPYQTESELLMEFTDIGWHGTKIVIFNLWQNDDGEPELDFDSDKQDIQLRGSSKLERTDVLQKQLTNQHISSCLRYSLRAYSSILYLRMPSNFQIILRGKVVQHLSIENDLKFAEHILYKPQVGSTKDCGGIREVSVITTIGFAKEAPMVNVHGFNVYHKNRLIMPFWKVFHENSSRGKGVVGVLEANFIEPAHDKQDFERTPILQRLETRLKQMTIEYWNLHCELIGYQPPRQPGKLRCPPSNASFPVQTGAGQTGARPQNLVATGIPAMVEVQDYPNTMVEAKQTFAGSPGVESHNLHQKFSSAHLFTGNDGKRDTNLNGSTRNSSAASAPSTPPQPGSDMGVVIGKHFEIVPCEKCDEQKMDNSTQNGECEDVPQVCVDSKPQINGEEVSLQKRPASALCLADLGAALKRQETSLVSSYHVPPCDQEGIVSVQIAEVLEEVEQLRLRCVEYQCREKALEIKISQLEQELLDTRSKYLKLLGEQQLKQPKTEN
eukprot:c26454_g1_i1 orf=114-2621(+)